MAILPFLTKLVKGDCPTELNIYILFIMYLLNTALTYLLFAYKKSILEATQRNDYISMNDTITTGLTNVIQLILLLFWKSIYVYYLYVMTMLAFTIINNILNARIVDKKYPQYKCRGKLGEEERKVIKKQVSGLVVSRICQMTRNSFDSIFVSAFIGLTMTTIYNNYYYVVNSVVGVMNIPLPDFEKIHEQMIQMGKHADLSFLWIDYKKEHPNGYQLAQFYKLYRDFMVDTYGTSKTSMPVERIPGEKMYIDWVGDQPELLLDTTTGELRKVHIFTTTLGFSSLVYAEIFPDEKLPHFITGTVHALSYYGAVPKYLVPDNLRTAVTRHSKDELVLQSAFSDLETFYDTIILPPPPRKPKANQQLKIMCVSWRRIW